MRNVLLILVAVLAAGATAMLARNWVAAERAALAQARQPAAAEAPAPMAMVLVAGADLNPGQFVQSEHLRWQAWPKAALSPSYVVQGQGEDKDFVGAVARSPVGSGEPITDARFAKPGDRGFLAAVLEPGMRAITVPITATSGNAGFVFPGDRVDLILTSRMEEGERAHQFADTVLEAVRVLAIDQRLAAQGEAAVGKTATIEVTPGMVEKVALALQMGTLSLSLRSLGMEGEAKPVPVEPLPGPTPTIDRELYATPAAPSPRGAAGGSGTTRKPAVMLLRGAESSEVTF